MSADEENHNKPRLIKINLDERSLARATADIEHERKIAIYDLLDENYFEPVGGGGTGDLSAGDPAGRNGPFELGLSIVERKLVFDVSIEGGETARIIHLSLMPLRKIIKDYFMLCESYHNAIRNAAPAHIETVDMARRALHNEGAVILRERLEDKIIVDHNTARRLFTLICSFHMR